MTKITRTGTNPPLGFNEDLLKGVKQESDKRLREDVLRVLVDSKDMENLFNSYIRNVLVWVKKEKVEDQNEKRMKSIENKLGVTDASRTEYRYWIIEQIHIGAVEGKPFTFETDQRLRRALEDVLVERHLNAPMQPPQYNEEEGLEIIRPFRPYIYYTSWQATED